MNEYLWPAVTVVCAVLAFVRLKPQRLPPPVRRKRVQLLEAEVRRLTSESGSQHGRIFELEQWKDKAEKGIANDMKAAGKRLTEISEDMIALKADWSKTKNRSVAQQLAGGARID